MNSDNNTKLQVKTMILRREVIERIKGRDDIKPDLAIALNLHRGSINRLLNENEPNGKLTTVASIDLICEKLDLSMDEVLTEQAYA